MFRVLALVILSGCGFSPPCNEVIESICVNEGLLYPQTFSDILDSLEKLSGENIRNKIAESNLSVLFDQTNGSSHYDIHSQQIVVNISEYYQMEKSLTHELIHFVEVEILRVSEKNTHDHTHKEHWLRYGCDSWEGITWEQVSGLWLNCEPDGYFHGFY